MSPPNEAPLIEPQSRTVSDAEHGLRLDQAMAELFPDYSRSRLAAWIKSGRATIDGAEAKPRQAVATGQARRQRIVGPGYDHGSRRHKVAKDSARIWQRRLKHDFTVSENKSSPSGIRSRAGTKVKGSS